MIYVEQAGFLRTYRRRSSMFVLIIILAGVFGLAAEPRAATFIRDMFAVLVAALAYAIDYNPKYLHLRFEQQKKFAWIVRIRWVIAGLVLIVGVASARNLRDALIAIGSAAWIAAVNAVSRGQTAHEPGNVPVLFPLRYAAADFLLIALLFRLGMHLLLVSVLLACAAHLALVINEGRSRSFPWFLLGAGGAFLVLAARTRHHGWETYVAALVLFFAAGLGTLLLVAMVRGRNALNVEQTVADLVDFTHQPREQVLALLAESTEILTRNWNQSHPEADDREGLAEWYRANSKYYLFDLAAFHLASKQIEFTLDILALANGKCLDYGAGNGELALALARLGHRTTYYDLDGTTKQFAAWRAAREALNLEFLSDRNLLAASAGKFDTVISLDVLEHMPDIAGELDFLASLLGPGGTLVLSAPVGGTESHPMHLEHRVDVAAHLRSRGLEDAKTFGLRWRSSEYMRKKSVFVFRKPVGTVTEQVLIAPRISQRPVG
jgi:2-polyprenyl-3-methyl-5-hydroxy-6-metoxy-1,4-benzoquinol methylase